MHVHDVVFSTCFNGRFASRQVQGKYDLAVPGALQSMGRPVVEWFQTLVTLG